ncbi:hypothetical protein N7532_002265 [Penicillium argentinense]|uniref:Nitrate reductase [NADPH] n=1 Tax=Penicillium argentinense TaxID=1131581 RepID=A0A9W9KKG1_9EURO|nr:uncharacterized protein N7532_002265 [Penicillium argentinense]KAJ5109620.1 hypothetical protein N7532_002265 [Penicillium argentinense]
MENSHGQQTKKLVPGLIAALAGSAAVFTWIENNPDSLSEAPPKLKNTQHDTLKATGKFFKLEEIRQHGPDSDRPWIMRGNKVYDITDWIESHPGGKVILRAAGSAVEPYWDIFTIHKKTDVYQILEQYLIGHVDPDDLVDGQVPKGSIEDPFSGDPIRDSSLVVLTDRPCNAESPMSGLTSFITSTALFYVRHHFWVPQIAKESYKMTIDIGDGSDEKTYTLRDLQTKFPQHTITATLQCSGNRRAHMNEGSGRDASGLKWGAGAISNAEWRGPLLRDVLADAGFDVDSPPGDLQHVEFYGEDTYSTSVPIDKVLDPRQDVLLACEMNGETLTGDHGYPVRALVPGNTAARSVKWVNRISLLEDESQSQWQQRDYKGFGPNETRDTIDWDSAPCIQDTPVQSAITTIRPDQNNDRSDSMVVEGYAFSGGGRKIVRVDVSIDNGKTWTQAKIEPHKHLGHKTWSWSLWTHRCRRPPADSCVIVKAVDEAYNSQPDSFGPIWNFRGVLANAWHRVRIDKLFQSDTD